MIMVILVAMDSCHPPVSKYIWGICRGTRLIPTILASITEEVMEGTREFVGGKNINNIHRISYYVVPMQPPLLVGYLAPIPAEKESSAYSWQGRAYNWHVGAPDAKSVLHSILPYMRDGFFVFQDGGWGAAAPYWGLVGVLPPTFDYLLTNSLYMRPVHILPCNFPSTIHALPCYWCQDCGN